MYSSKRKFGIRLITYVPIRGNIFIRKNKLNLTPQYTSILDYSLIYIPNILRYQLLINYLECTNFEFFEITLLGD